MGAGPPLEMFSGEYVGHLVDDALLLLADPLGGENGSADEDLSGVCLVAYLDALGVADEHDGVVADDVASPDRMDADLLASGTYSLAPVDELLSAHLLADDLSDGHGGSAGSVLLLVVVGLDNLHVVVVAEEACGLLAELHEGGDTDGVVGTDDRGDVVLDDLAGDHGLVLGGEAGGTDDEVDTAPGCDGCVDDGGLGDGEVDVDVDLGLLEDLLEVLGVGYGDSDLSDACDVSDVLSDPDEIEGGCDGDSLGGHDALDEHGAHSSACSDHSCSDFCHNYRYAIRESLYKLEFDIYGGNSDRFWEEIRFSDGSVSFSVIAFGRFLRSSGTVSGPIQVK